MEISNGILLDSGTNELEIIEFEVGHSRFGINVIKVKEIILPIPVTFIPHSHPYIEGIIQLRGEVLPVVDLKKVLQLGNSANTENEKYIVTEFNQQKVVFHVHNVSQIHRISWGQIEKPSDMYSGDTTQIIGVIKQNDHMILMLDFERIITEINPETGINKNTIKKLGTRERSSKKVVVAEDSALLRKLIYDTLLEAGYENVEFFENGKDAYNYLEAIVSDGKKIEEEVQLVITDIEMPQMDGHHLTKKIKDDNQLSKLPVIIFSSLITESLRHKGEIVGADDQVSKPEIMELILKMDKYIL
ncbi:MULTISPECIES: chemotaxis protein [Heyndrickxia]|uniref:chemotaxis protein n=1 Tax=Heyndrickxia TaxID=2837504 RepID=UPI00039EFD9D|nr:chemotaxis protein [Heyndrickxia oleronia]GIN37732.1 chemotaxis protein CheV [Heyndrickxia oleronia]